MTYQTQLHQWPVPEDGQEPYLDSNGQWRTWGDDLQETIEAIDNHVSVKDTIANRPAPGVVDRWYVAHDEPAIYYDDGSAWLKIAGVDGSGETATADEFLATSDGTAADPSFAFDADADTGIYRPGADTLGLVTGGVRGLEIDSGQNVVLPNGDLSDGVNTIWDSTNAWVPESALEKTYAALAENESVTGTWDRGDGVPLRWGTDADIETWFDGSGTTPVDELVWTADPTSTSPLDLLRLTKGGTLQLLAGDLTDGTTTIWDSASAFVPQSSVEQGAGSGLDADTLDGVQLANINWVDVAMAQADVSVSDLGAADAAYDTNGNNLIDGTVGTGGVTIWDAASAFIPDARIEQASLDAATLDGIDSASFLRSDVADSLTATLSINADLDTGGSVPELIWDDTNQHVPAARVEQGEGSGLDADQWEGYDLQKNGTDGTGVINFKT